MLAPTVSPNLDDPWAAQVRSFRVQYGKSEEWEQWMLDPVRRERYRRAFGLQRDRQWPLNINVRYKNDVPLPYAHPWPNEQLHTEDLGLLLNLTFPRYQFSMAFNQEPTSRPGQITLYLNATGSGAHPGFVDVQWETILGHEMAHIFGIDHHYWDSDINTIIDMPPGESICIMARRGGALCSGCRTALGIPLDIDNNRQVEQVIQAIYDRYPANWAPLTGH